MGASRSILRAITLALTAALAAALATACGPAPTPVPGKLTVRFTPDALTTPELRLDMATLRLGRIVVFGSVPPPPGMMPPMPTDVMLDALSPTGASLTFESLRQGIYSRVQLLVENAALDGAWRGRPFHARLGGMFGGGMVDLRSPTGRELAPGQDVTFEVGVAPNQWLGDGLLDTAVVSPDGQIICDMQQNPTLARELIDRVARSFFLR